MQPTRKFEIPRCVVSGVLPGWLVGAYPKSTTLHLVYCQKNVDLLGMLPVGSDPRNKRLLLSKNRVRKSSVRNTISDFQLGHSTGTLVAEGCGAMAARVAH